MARRYVSRKSSRSTRRRAAARRPTRRARGRRTYARSAETGVRSVSRIYCADPFTATTVPDTYTSASFGFNPVQMQDWTTYSQLYEQYKMGKITMTFEPMFSSNLMINSTDPASALTAQSLRLGRFATVLDNTNATAPSIATPTPLQARAAFYNDKTVRWTPFNRTHTRTFRVAFPEDLNANPVTTYTTPVNPWVATATPITQYLGIKCFVDDWFSGPVPQQQPLAWRVYIKYTVLFRHAK